MSGSADRETRWDLLGRAALAGGAGAVIVIVVALALGKSSASAVELAFSLAGLPFSLGLLGWSMVLLAGDGIERFSTELGLSSTWTATGARQAMALLIAAGGGGMLVAGLIGAILGV